MLKILGMIIGYIYGGFLGLLAGLYVGWLLDRKLRPHVARWLVKALHKHLQKTQRTFFETTFQVMGHLAKADGRVSEQEIQVARQIMAQMQLDENATREAMALFSKGKEPGFDLDAALSPLRLIGRRQRNLMQMFIEIQLRAAMADGEIDEAERRVLQKICITLGFTEQDLVRLEAMMKAERHSHQAANRQQGMELVDAYSILDITEQASDAEVKKAYRKLINQHHPDKLAAKGLPTEMMKLAEEKSHEIRTAYERIREQRGFK